MKVNCTVVQEANKDMKSVQSFQLFVMAVSNPGVVSCRMGPDTEVVAQDLRRSFDGIITYEEKVRGLFESHLDPLQSPAPNFEKKQHTSSKVRPYVPMEFRSEPIYDAPNDEEEQLANEAKKARRKASAKRKKVATATAEAKDTAPVPDGGEAVALAGKIESQTVFFDRSGTAARSIFVGWTPPWIFLPAPAIRVSLHWSTNPQLCSATIIDSVPGRQRAHQIRRKPRWLRSL
jgi:hypothetical protein